MPNFSAPLFDGLDTPVTPHRGNTPQARANSLSGAVYAAVGRKGKAKHLLALYAVPRSMQDIAEISGWPISSVCSLTQNLRDGKAIEEAGQQVKVWPNGSTTTRTTWQATQVLKVLAVAEKTSGGNSPEK